MGRTAAAPRPEPKPPPSARRRADWSSRRRLRYPIGCSAGTAVLAVQTVHAVLGTAPYVMELFS